MLSSVLYLGKYFIIAGIMAIFVASLVLIVWSLISMGKKIILGFKDIFQNPSHERKRFDIEIISVVDSILIAILLYLFSAGLFELFYGKDITPDWLEWLVVNDIFDLKNLLISMVIVILAITFMRNFIEWKDGKNTLYFGIAVAAVIIALTFYVSFRFIVPHT